MIMAFDVGNTMTVLGVMDGARVRLSWRIVTRERTEDEYSLLVSSLIHKAGIDGDSVDKAAVSSVVPSETGPIALAVKRDLGIDVSRIDWRSDCGIAIDTENPMEVGGDRIANAAGAFYEYGGPVIIVDMGTATTYDHVTSLGEYKGGLIAPGIVSGARHLWEIARMLPEVELARPGVVVGRTTIEAMQSGIYHGAIGQIEGIVRRMWAETGGECRVVLTGGYSELVKDDLGFEAVYAPQLTLKGIAYAVDPGLRKRGGPGAN
jgi:type III pantothenate kinase